MIYDLLCDNILSVINMNAISLVILIFALLGAIDFLIGNKFGIGKEFEKAFSLFAPMALSMLGMLVVAPAIGQWLLPVFEWFYNVFGIDPSIIPASLFANDMGGATLSAIVFKNEEIGNFSAYIVSSMMGCVISFTIPFALGVVKREQHKEMFFGILCGIVTIPIGCFVAGLMCRINIGDLILTLLPLIIFSLVVALLLIFLKNICIKIFSVFGFFMRTLALAGLIISIFTFLTKIQISKYFDTFENAAFICANACVTLSGALPLMAIVSRLLNKPMEKIGSSVGINSVSAVALLATLVTNASTFGVMDKMNKKGVVLNSAFAVSAAFVFGSHLAFTMAFDKTYIAPMIVGKIISGVCSIVLAFFLYKEEKETV